MRWHGGWPPIKGGPEHHHPPKPPLVPTHSSQSSLPLLLHPPSRAQQLAMAQGSGSATAVLVLVLLCVLLHGDFAESKVYTVGDRAGWALSSGGWPRGKRFRAGDVLLFRYGRGAHNVVAVSAAAYKSCSAARGGRTYNSGSDRVTLSRGTNYFICSVPGHCQAGMKMAVTAA
ncbi:hypothetical protein VPH35_071408 [Triticum aestivum]